MRRMTLTSVALLVLALFGAGCLPPNTDPLPFTSNQEAQEYIQGAATMMCPEGFLQIIFLEKEGSWYRLASLRRAGETYGHFLLVRSQGAQDTYLWSGTYQNAPGNQDVEIIQYTGEAIPLGTAVTEADFCARLRLGRSI